jgi:hypothetical protein
MFIAGLREGKSPLAAAAFPSAYSAAGQEEFLVHSEAAAAEERNMRSRVARKKQPGTFGN